MSDGVFAGLASFGNRGDILRVAVESLLDQVDRMGVYLNGYDRVPDFLEHPAIEVARSQDHGDIRDNGKFFFLGSTSYRYYAAVDDDIEYPPDYISRMQQRLADAGPNSAVAVHGAVYPAEVLGLLKPRHLFHFSDALQHVMPVHLVGTGTLLFDQETWALERGEFGQPGMADVWFAAAARKRGARLFVVNRNRDWLVEAAEVDAGRGPRLFAEANLDDSRQVDVLEKSDVAGGGMDRLVLDLVESDAFVGEMTISQALLFDDVRRAVGLGVLSSSGAAQLRSTLGRMWDPTHEVRAEEHDSYRDVVVGLLTGEVSATHAVTAVTMLQRLAESARDRNFRRSLPFPLRFDIRRSRLERLTKEVLARAGSKSPDDTRIVWPALQKFGHLRLQDAIEAERAGLDTGFLDLELLERTAAGNPQRALAWLYAYHEARGWENPPRVLRWRMLLGDSFDDLETQLLLGVTAARSGHLEMAARVVEDARITYPADAEVRLLDAMVRSSAADIPGQKLSIGLAAIDEILAVAGIQPIGGLVGGEGSGHWMGQMVTDRPRADSSGPLVTVIMTVNNAAPTVSAAMESILCSVHGNLEVVVVDDHSTDSTAAVVAGFTDERVRLIQNGRNLGPYASRNVALRESHGAYVTMADADDWSHPGRIQHQLAFLESNSDRLGCTTAHVRLRADSVLDLENNLRFLGHGPVSLMFRRSLLEEVGGFDGVRTRGDLEFMRRVQARFGAGAIARLGSPMILASSSPSSNSKRYPSDALDRYRRAARQWHLENARSDRLFVSLDRGRAPFVAPAEILSSSGTRLG